jgi:hypothetical protein
MKQAFITTVLGLAAGLLCQATAAPAEQWLEYHTSTEPKGYRWIGLSTNAPAGVALPADLKPGALFGRWSNGMDPFKGRGNPNNGRVFCLDASRKAGPCDRIFFDQNGNGQLDDDVAIKSSDRDTSGASFPPIKVLFKTADGPVTYHLIARLYQNDKSRANLLVGSAGWYEGTVKLGGKPHQVQLIDSTVNAVFNDMTDDPYNSDRLMVDGGRSGQRYLGKYLEVDGQLLRLEVARDGAFIKVEKAEGVQYGTVKVPAGVTEVTAFSRNGHFTRQPTNGEFTLPTGRHRVNSWTLERKDEKGVLWKLSGSGFSGKAMFDVATNKAASLKIGEPVQTSLTFQETKTGGSFDLKLTGTLGETIEVMRGKERARAPKLLVASAEGSLHYTNTFEYG